MLPPDMVKDLLDREQFTETVFEPACGMGHIAEELIKNNYKVIATDILDRGYEKQNSTFDFFEFNSTNLLDIDIITNPPYSDATAFVEKSMSIIKNGRKLALLLKVTFLEGQKRYKLFKDYPPKKIYIYSRRRNCWPNGIKPDQSSMIAYAWYIWEKGFIGNPQIEWIY